MRRTQQGMFTGLRNIVLASALIGASAMNTRPLFAQTSVTQIQPDATTTSNSVNGALAPQSPFLGSVPTGAPTGTVLTLSLGDALDRGLKYNLGLIESEVRTRTARAARLKDLNALLPDVNASISQTAEQVNLRALGFNFSFPGVAIPAVVGPFGVQSRAQERKENKKVKKVEEK